MKSSLLSIPLFSDMHSEHLDMLSGQLQHIKYTRNSIIISEGDVSDSLYLVNKGEIKIYISDQNGREIQLNTLGPGDYFGELSLLDQKPRSASAITLCDSELSVISSKALMRCLNKSPAMAMRMLQSLAKGMRDATELQRRLALMDVYGRLRKTLLALSRRVDDMNIVEPKPTQQEIANMIGASREMVSRIITNLKINDYIETTRDSIIIRQELPDKL